MHKLLARQLRRKSAIAGDSEFELALFGLQSVASGVRLQPEAARLMEALPALFTEFENTYTQFDRDLELRRRSLEVSSAELLYVNNQLRKEAASRQRVLDSLREAANRLLSGAGLPVLREDEANLESLSSMMAELAHERELTRQKLSESEERLVLALNVTESVAWDWDIVRNKLVVIATGDEVLGFPRAQIEDDPPRIGDLVDRADSVRLRNKLVAHLRGDTPDFRFGVWMTIKGRDRRYMQFHGKVVARNSDGRALRMAGIMHDLTANKMAEEALRQSQVDAEAATRAKSQFLANMSHEIRTPMNGVLGMAELLLATPLNARQRQFAETVRRSGESLLTLINDILDFSKIEAGKMEIDVVDFSLREILEDVAQLLAESAASKGIELVCRMLPSVPAIVTGDPNRIRQILINLMGNAIKFTEHGEVVTEVRITDDTRLLCFEVRDTGIGIAPSAQVNVFNAFSQADGSMTRQHGGTGLGLAICRQLVNLMGGDIVLESEVGKGSLFRFTLPCRNPLPAKRSHSLKPHADFLSGKRLLIVDDNAACRDAVRDIAAGEFGMQCEVAADGVTALGMARAARARNAPYDVALIDAEMSGVAGGKLTAEFRRDAEFTGVRLMLALSLDRAGATSNAKVAGFVSAVTKPVRQADLLRALLLAFEMDPHLVSLKMKGARFTDGSASMKFSGRVLVAEDYPVNQQVVRAVLEGHGCDVHIANNGREALEAVQRTPYDLIFMDCQMPEMDGYTATRAIRALEAECTQGACRTPIVALTAHATQSDRERCLNAGMDSYVSKPFTQAILRRELQRWLPDNQADFAEAVTPPMAGASVERIDVRALDELRALEVQGNPGMLQGFVTSYVEHSRALLKRLRAAVEAGSAMDVEREAHTLKSGSLTLGAARVAELAHVMEQAGQSHRLVNCRPLVAQVEAEFALAEDLLQAAVPSACTSVGGEAAAPHR